MQDPDQKPCLAILAELANICKSFDATLKAILKENADLPEKAGGKTNEKKASKEDKNSNKEKIVKLAFEHLKQLKSLQEIIFDPTKLPLQRLQEIKKLVKNRSKLKPINDPRFVKLYPYVIEFLEKHIVGKRVPLASLLSKKPTEAVKPGDLRSLLSFGKGKAS